MKLIQNRRKSWKNKWRKKYKNNLLKDEKVENMRINEKGKEEGMSESDSWKMKGQKKKVYTEIDKNH